MEIQEHIINRVANSGLLTFDLASLKSKTAITVYDIKDNLFQGLILREKDFRAFVKEHDWSAYTDKNVLITCSADAIVPTWAYMLLTVHLTLYAKEIFYGNPETIEGILFDRAIQQMDFEQFRDQRVVVKGCGDSKIPESAFVAFTYKLAQVAKSIMYGEPCSTVPIYKRKEELPS